jgi:hypothetical protein
MKKREKRGFVFAAAPAVLFALVAAVVFLAAGNAGKSGTEQGRQVLEDSVRRAAVRCYAVEGRYPESETYLEEHYGIAYDQSEYAVHYEIFADNIMPDITVTLLA